MFFLFRCLFWLGLVFSHIAALEGTNASAFVPQSVRAVSEQAAGLSRTALDAASQRCAASPENCLALAAQAARLTQEPNGASRDSLSAGDRMPTWRARAGKPQDTEKASR